MGEVLMSGKIADIPEMKTRSEDKIHDGGGQESPATTAATNNNDDVVVRWEKFLPKMVLRVLLVEADDCTRHIITALLRKCSYKVAAVSDGLKAWEVLRQKSDSIDLILTEVELPSISGFALLTLIMEHQACKNIPVIMMSANDSVSTVYKCMLTGAADFLVKPVRKNELKNLWQHVWRRQASANGGNEQQQESDAQQKEEATAENNATSIRSSGYIACIKRNRECIEKGSDAQSSCTKPDTEADVPTMEQPTDHRDTQEANGLVTQPNEPEGNLTNAEISGQGNNTTIDVRWEQANAVGNTSREAIDLIGSFDSYPKPSLISSLNYGGNKVDHPTPMLDLSLKRSHPSSSVNQFSDDRHRLKPSDVSAFSRYINRTQPPLTSGSASICNQQKDSEIKNPVEYMSDTHSAPVGSSQHNRISQHGQTESLGQTQSQFPSPRESMFPVPGLVRGIRLENTLPPPFCVQPNVAQMQSPSSSGHHEQSLFQAHPYHMSNPEARNESAEMHNATEALEDHSGSSSFYTGGTLTRLNSIGSGSNGNNSHRSMQREAALNKFRMKRKDRCFDKKVRYESRKKLAEQRPRVKGQFVRQGQTSNPSLMEVDTELASIKTTA
uniref:two-component response regulator-like APRR5 n=1 Tax=Erigeron canadensis TaxID=72917 RepID=UPI001CB94901|nr:two-component response regulator-like APRR5 [Erigeron canadensis]